MAGTDFYYADSQRQICQTGHMGGYLENLLACLRLSPAPASIEQLNATYRATFGEALFNPGNVPKVPEELPLGTIRLVFGMPNKPAEEVLAYWERFHGYTRPDYTQLTLDDSIDTESPIPTIDQALINEWKESPRSEYRTIEAYRRALAPGDGIVIVDFRAKTLTYLSDHFTLKRSDLPRDWKLVRA